MGQDHIEQRDGSYYLAGTRVPLDCIVFEFRIGASAESIRQTFPSLTLDQVYGAVAFHLGHQAEVDTSIRDAERAWREFEPNHPMPEPMSTEATA